MHTAKQILELLYQTSDIDLPPLERSINHTERLIALTEAIGAWAEETIAECSSKPVAWCKPADALAARLRVVRHELQRRVEEGVEYIHTNRTS